jgi:hypothetical protein
MKYQYGDRVQIDRSGVEWEVMWTAGKDANGEQTKLRIRKVKRRPAERYTQQINVADIVEHTPVATDDTNRTMREHMALMETQL